MSSEKRSVPDLKMDPYPDLLVLLVLCDDAANATDKHHLVVRNETHELMFTVAIEQHQDPHLLLCHL